MCGWCQAASAYFWSVVSVTHPSRTLHSAHIWQFASEPISAESPVLSKTDASNCFATSAEQTHCTIMLGHFKPPSPEEWWHLSDRPHQSWLWTIKGDLKTGNIGLLSLAYQTLMFPLASCWGNSYTLGRAYHSVVIMMMMSWWNIHCRHIIWQFLGVATLLSIIVIAEQLSV